MSFLFFARHSLQQFLLKFNEFYSIVRPHICTTYVCIFKQKCIAAKFSIISVWYYNSITILIHDCVCYFSQHCKRFLIVINTNLTFAVVIYSIYHFYPFLLFKHFSFHLEHKRKFIKVISIFYFSRVHIVFSYSSYRFGVALNSTDYLVGSG